MKSLRKREVILLLLFSWVFYAGEARAQNFQRKLSQWREVSENIASLMDQKGFLVSSSAMMWPDGKPVLVTYLRVDNDIYRCLDWYDQDFQPSGFQCYIAEYVSKYSEDVLQGRQ